MAFNKINRKISEVTISADNASFGTNVFKIQNGYIVFAEEKSLGQCFQTIDHINFSIFNFDGSSFSTTGLNQITYDSSLMPQGIKHFSHSCIQDIKQIDDLNYQLITTAIDNSITKIGFIKITFDDTTYSSYTFPMVSEYTVNSMVIRPYYDTTALKIDSSHYFVFGHTNLSSVHTDTLLFDVVDAMTLCSQSDIITSGVAEYIDSTHILIVYSIHNSSLVYSKVIEINGTSIVGVTSSSQFEFNSVSKDNYNFSIKKVQDRFIITFIENAIDTTNYTRVLNYRIAVLRVNSSYDIHTSLSDSSLVFFSTSSLNTQIRTNIDSVDNNYIVIGFQDIGGITKTSPIMIKGFVLTDNSTDYTYISKSLDERIRYDIYAHPRAQGLFPFIIAYNSNTVLAVESSTMLKSPYPQDLKVYAYELIDTNYTTPADYSLHSSISINKSFRKIKKAFVLIGGVWHQAVDDGNGVITGLKIFNDGQFKQISIKDTYSTPPSSGNPPAPLNVSANPVNSYSEHTVEPGHDFPVEIIIPANISITWDAVVWENGIDYYNVFIYDDNDNLIKNIHTNSTSTNYSDGTAGNTYKFKVKTIDKSGEESTDFSNEVSAVFPT